MLVDATIELSVTAEVVTKQLTGERGRWARGAERLAHYYARVLFGQAPAIMICKRIRWAQVLAAPRGSLLERAAGRQSSKPGKQTNKRPSQFQYIKLKVPGSKTTQISIFGLIESATLPLNRKPDTRVAKSSRVESSRVELGQAKRKLCATVRASELGD